MDVNVSFLLSDQIGARKSQVGRSRSFRGRRARQQESRRLGAHHFQDQVPQVRHRGRHHHS